MQVAYFIFACVGVVLISLIIGAIAAIFTDRRRGATYVQHTD